MAKGRRSETAKRIPEATKLPDMALPSRQANSPTISTASCKALAKEAIWLGLDQDCFDKARWFPWVDRVALFVRPGRDPNDEGERIIAARKCLTEIAERSQTNPDPLLALLGVLRGHCVGGASLERRESVEMGLYGTESEAYFRKTLKPQWQRRLALEVYREITRDED